MKKLLLISLTIVTFACAKGFGLGHMEEKQPASQQFIAFPESFLGRHFYSAEQNFIGISGYYLQNNRRYFAAIGNSVLTDPLASEQWISTAAEHISFYDSFHNFYYNQFFNYKFDAVSGTRYLFSDSLNYVFSGTNKEDEEGTFLDSIPQASSINDLVYCKDSLLYASIVNNNRNFIVRKKGRSASWETLPIVVSTTTSGKSLGNLFLMIGIACLFLAALLLLALLRRKAKDIERELAKDNDIYNKLKLAADKPLDYEQITNKDTKDAIDAIVEVIQNRNTPLPMTIAINGAWGSGKSTIMNCIRQRLDVDSEERFITTWFNAWHQQTESSLLNAFLLKIITRYEKPFFSNSSKAAFAFIRFRFQLASSRFVKWSFYNQLLSGFALSFIFIIVAIIMLNLYGLQNAPIFTQAGWNINITSLFTDDSLKSMQPLGSIIALVLSVFSFFILRSESTPTIGAFLNVMYKKSFLVDVEKNSPDLREKFRTQYWEIMEAVDDRVLIVFIDDLDRVTGDKIFEMLEAINFIGDVTSRPDDSDKHSLKTVFVLGLYTDQVAEQLGIYLQKENPFSEKNDAEKARQDAKVLGKRYIEKMVQLNVPVPLNSKDV